MFTSNIMETMEIKIAMDMTLFMYATTVQRMNLIRLSQTEKEKNGNVILIIFNLLSYTHSKWGELVKLNRTWSLKISDSSHDNWKSSCHRARDVCQDRWDTTDDHMLTIMSFMWENNGQKLSLCCKLEWQDIKSSLNWFCWIHKVCKSVFVALQKCFL